MPYRLEFLEDMVFRVPSLRKILSLVFLVNTLGLLAFYHFSVADFVLYDFVFMLIGLITVSVVGSELIGLMASDVPRSWNYIDSAAFTAIFWAALISLEAPQITSTSSSILVGFLTAFTLNHTYYVIVAGEYGLSLEDAASIVMPILLAILFFLFSDRIGYSMIPVSEFFLSMGGLLLVLSLNKELNEYFFGINLGERPGALLASELLLMEEDDVPGGKDSRIPVRNLSIENEQGKFTGYAPWIHPGPLANYGGGDISWRTVHDNENCFFIHMPSSHYSDIADMESNKKMLEKIQPAEITEGTATSLVWDRSENFVVIGRRYGDHRIIYIGSEVYDDYERSIFHKYLYDESVTIVDIHGNEDEYEKLNYSEEDSLKLIESIENVLEKLDQEEDKEYQAGWSVMKRKKSLMALVERVDSENTLILGVDENDKSEETYCAIEEFREEFDNIIAFTTDTHKSVYDQTVGFPNDFEDYVEVIEKAKNSVSGAGIGFNYTEVEDVKLLQDKYEELVETINILSRLYPVMVFLTSSTYIVAAVKILV